MLLDLEEKTRVLVEDIVERSAIGSGAIFVLGLSSSEVVGGIIGKASSREIGQRIVKTILEVLEPKGIYLAVQGCEHLNRALVVERELALKIPQQMGDKGSQFGLLSKQMKSLGLWFIVSYIS